MLKKSEHKSIEVKESFSNNQTIKVENEDFNDDLLKDSKEDKNKQNELIKTCKHFDSGYTNQSTISLDFKVVDDINKEEIKHDDENTEDDLNLDEIEFNGKIN